jgi:hypothetical protein
MRQISEDFIKIVDEENERQHLPFVSLREVKTEDGKGDFKERRNHCDS